MTSQKFGSALMWAVLATGIAQAQANDSIDPLAGTEKPSIIRLNSEQIKELCTSTKNKSGLIIDGEKACKVSERKKRTMIPTVAEKPTILAKKPMEQKPSVQEQKPIIQEQKPIIQEEKNIIPKKTEKPKQLRKVPEPMKQEVSIDKGKTWIPIKQALLLGAGWLLGGWLLLRNRKKSKKQDNVAAAPYKYEPSLFPETLPAYTPSEHAEAQDKPQTEEMILTKSWDTFTTRKIPRRSKNHPDNNKDKEIPPIIQTNPVKEALPPLEFPANIDTPPPAASSLSDILSEGSARAKKIETSVVSQWPLDSNLRTIDKDHKKTLETLNTICRQLQGFIDDLPSKGEHYKSDLSYLCFFWKSLQISAKKTSPREPYTYSFELTLYGTKGIYATKEHFTDLKTLRGFIQEKAQEEYEFRYQAAIKRMNLTASSKEMKP